MSEFSTLARRAAICALTLGSLILPARLSSGFASTPEPAVERELVARIRQQAFESSQVMAIARVLCKDIGPRVTGTPTMDKAGRWAARQFSAWGLTNVAGEAWKLPFKGWSVESVSVRMITPEPVAIPALPAAWSPATRGRIKAPVVAVQAESIEDLHSFKGKLAEKILLVARPRPEMPPWSVPPRRLDSARLGELGAPPKPERKAAASGDRDRAEKARNFREELLKFAAREKVAVLVEESYHRNPEVTGIGLDGMFDKKVPMLAIPSAHFRRIASEAKAGKEVELEVEIAAQFHSTEFSHNVIAEIPGTQKPDEVVLAGAHLDSWPGAEGATDNAAGVAVVMEAARILTELKLQPARTIRFVLWSGEEQGLLGSRAHVQHHYIRRVNGGTIEVTPEYFRVSAYFNLDNGSGAIRGIYSQENEEVIPIFRAWVGGLPPEFGEMVISPRNDFGSDHAHFDRYGIPAFTFIQDPLDYFSKTHHSPHDTYEMLEADDLKQAAAVVALLLYQTANREQLLPRKKQVTARLATP